MPSDDDGLAPTEGPDWENGFSDSLRNFEEAVTLWRRREEATCEEKIAGRNLNQRTVASCDFTAEDCLKAHFPAREDDESDAPLQALVKVAKSQREELQEVLELVQNHAERFEGHSSLTAQLPEQGSASARKSGADVVALLAELLDVASRNFSKQRGKEDDRREERNGRGRDEHRLRERREVRKDDYRRDDRRREEDERYEDDRRRARDGAGRDDGRRDRDRGKDDYDHRRDERRHDDRYEDDRRGREGGRDDGRHYRAKDDYRRDDRRDDRYDDRRPPGPRREERPRSRSRGDAAA